MLRVVVTMNFRCLVLPINFGRSIQVVNIASMQMESFSMRSDMVYLS